MNGRAPIGLIAASLAFPLVLGTGLFIASGATLPQIAGSITLQIYYCALIVTLAGYAISGTLRKDYGRLFIGVGLMLLLVQGAVLYGGRLSGTARIGVGESLGVFERLDAGPWASIKPLPISLTAAAEAPDESCTLQIGDASRKIAAGGTFSWAGRDIRCIGVHRAPLLRLLDQKGKELEGGYFPYADRDDIPEYVQFKIVPHRFYLSRQGQRSIVWRRVGDVWGTVPAEEQSHGGGDSESLQLRIVRGKLTLFEGDIRKGAAIPFDGHRIQYSGTELWAEIGIKQKQKPLLFWIGAVMIMYGAISRVCTQKGRS